MINLSIEQEIRDLFPEIAVGLLTGQVKNTGHSDALQQEIQNQSNHLRSTHTFESIREIAAIESGKKAYRLLGKDPNRYRISAEAMIRRLVKGQDLYQINTVVDSLNLVSLRSGVTIGGFDLDQVKPPVRLSIGGENEPFTAIGRGDLNIHRLPVYRDESGAIGSPTSDCTRTMLKLNTINFLMIVTDFFGQDLILSTLENLKDTLSKYANGTNFEVSVIN